MMNIENAANEVPSRLRFTADHMWVGVVRDGWLVGVTRFGESKVGELVYVDVPHRGASIRAGTAFSFLESSKAIVDLIAPVSASVIASNEHLSESPTLINRDPYGDGWICLIESQDSTQLGALLDAAAYRQLLIDLAHVEGA